MQSKGRSISCSSNSAIVSQSFDYRAINREHNYTIPGRFHTTKRSEMFTEKSKLSGKRENPFYGSYQEKSANEGIQWKSQQKRRQLAIVTTIILALTLLAIGITIAITLPPLIENSWNKTLHPADPISLTISSDSVLRGPYDNAGVSSDDSICSDIGKTILQTQNGSVVDSAIAVALCLGVVAPHSSGLGGGLMMTVYIDRKMYSLNALEKVPAGVSSDAFLNNPQASHSGGLAVGIPSELAGLFAAHQKFGKLKWAELVKPARDLAQNGFRVSRYLGKSLKLNSAHISKDPVLHSEFFNSNGQPWIEGDKMTRPRLARTLEKLGNSGVNDFYNGTIASQIVEEINGVGGVFSQADLSSHKIQWVESIIYQLRNNLTLVSLPFPSSGPIVGMTLGILQHYGRKDASQFNAKENGVDIHRLVEALRFANGHRSLVADPDFSKDDSLLQLQVKMLSTDYASQLQAKIFDYRSFVDPTHYGAEYIDAVDSGASQISIIGPNGDAISLTSSINSPFGAGFMGNLTGIIYNNKMAAFSTVNQNDSSDRSANPYNFVEPGKQPGSSMAPLIFLNATGSPVFSTGSSGGLNSLSAIISTTWRALYRDFDIKAATDYPRISPGFNPLELQYEYGIPAPIIDDLHRKGHKTSRISRDAYLGNVNSVCRTKRTTKILANADFRNHGESTGF